MSDKPKFSLLPGKQVLDADKLAQLYEKMTGKKPTAEEMAKAREKLAQAKK